VSAERRARGSGRATARRGGTRKAVGWCAAGAWLLLAACAPAKSGESGDKAPRQYGDADSAAPAAAESPDAVRAGTQAGLQGAGTGSLEAGTQTLDDNMILALLASANKAEIDAGRSARGRAADSAVRAFAQTMIDDHSVMQRQADQLGARLRIAPQPLANDSIEARAAAAAERLGALRGAEFDRAYVEIQVRDHQNTLRFLQAASGAAAAPELKGLVQQIVPAVQQHLQRARDLRAQLGAATAADAAGAAAPAGRQ
jgi:putative membrane protein